MLYFEKRVFNDVKYDIPMCQYHSTRPQPIQLVPTMQKKLFTSSFQAKFLKIRYTKVAGTSSFLMCQQIFFFPILYHSQGHIWAKMAHYGPPLTPKKWPKTDPYEPKMAKNVLRTRNTWRLLNSSVWMYCLKVKLICRCVDVKFTLSFTAITPSL